MGSLRKIVVAAAAYGLVLCASTSSQEKQPSNDDLNVALMQSTFLIKGYGNATKAKGYAGLLVATATGTNKQGATTYNLTLYDQNKVVATGTGFSGNNNFAETGAIKNGNYQILGRFDAPPTGPNPASADNNPPPVYGYQKIDPSLNSYANAVYQAYGPMRARLNPLDPSNTDGVYFHGQFGDAFHSEGWTHGCLSYGRDTTMINYMGDHFGNAWTGVSVNTPVVKP